MFLTETILKISRVKEQIYMKGSPQFCLQNETKLN